LQQAGPARQQLSQRMAPAAANGTLRKGNLHIRVVEGSPRNGGAHVGSGRRASAQAGDDVCHAADIVDGGRGACRANGLTLLFYSIFFQDRLLLDLLPGAA
jgi:hypothetical protein